MTALLAPMAPIRPEDRVYPAGTLGARSQRARAGAAGGPSTVRADVAPLRGPSTAPGTFTDAEIARIAADHPTVAIVLRTPGQSHTAEQIARSYAAAFPDAARAFLSNPAAAVPMTHASATAAAGPFTDAEIKRLAANHPTVDTIASTPSNTYTREQIARMYASSFPTDARSFLRGGK